MPSDLPPGVAWLLALLVAIGVVILLARVARARARRRRALDETPQLLEPAAADSERATSSWEQQVLDFALELRRSDSRERLHQTIVQRLPAILGVERIWIVARFGDRRQTIASGPDGAAAVNPLIAAEGDWATFPIKVADQPVGVLGVATGQQPLPARTRRAVAAIVPLLAETLHAQDLIAQLRELSSVDQLTGCATRQMGLQRLRAELTRAHRASRELAVLMIDLDYFKSINDRFGHACGDAVLGAVGSVLTHTLRESDIRCRWGGEEFLVVLPETGIEQAKRVAVTVARRISEIATYCGAARVQVTASVGVSISARDDEDPDALIARADTALYRAKADGRNCVRVLLSDSKAAPAPPAPVASGPIPFRERRDPSRADRREHAGYGRRKTDVQERVRVSDRTARSPVDPA